jgi:hypothetical protein
MVFWKQNEHNFGPLFTSDSGFYTEVMFPKIRTNGRYIVRVTFEAKNLRCLHSVHSAIGSTPLLRTAGCYGACERSILRLNIPCAAKHYVLVVPTLRFLATSGAGDSLTTETLMNSTREIIL